MMIKRYKKSSDSIDLSSTLGSSSISDEPKPSHLPLVPHQLGDRGPVTEGCHLETMESIGIDWRADEGF